MGDGSLASLLQRAVRWLAGADFKGKVWILVHILSHCQRSGLGTTGWHSCQPFLTFRYPVYRDLSKTLLLEDDATKNNLVHSEGPRVYKGAHPGGKNGNLAQNRNPGSVGEAQPQSRIFPAEGLCIAIRIAAHY